MHRQPVGAKADFLFKTQPHVRIVDNSSIMVDYDQETYVRVSILPSSNPLVAQLGGNQTVCSMCSRSPIAIAARIEMLKHQIMQQAKCCWGICKFTDLTISKASTQYVLQFDSAGMRPAFSEQFEIFGPTKLFVEGQPRDAISTLSAGQQPVIQVGLPF